MSTHVHISSARPAAQTPPQGTLARIHEAHTLVGNGSDWSTLRAIGQEMRYLYFPNSRTRTATCELQKRTRHLGRALPVQYRCPIALLFGSLIWQVDRLSRKLDTRANRGQEEPQLGSASACSTHIQRGGARVPILDNF